MFGIWSVKAINELLSSVYSERLSGAVVPEGKEVRGPIGLFLVREDGAGGSKLAREVVGSFEYWHARTGHFFDAIFLGWGFDGVPAFHAYSFNGCVSELEQDLNWSYRGGADLLLTDFVYTPANRSGSLDFSKTVAINITELLDDRKIRQLGPLMEELTAPSRLLRESQPEVSVMEVSDYIALLRTRRFFWKALLKKVGPLLGWADEVMPYAVRDLRKGA